MPFSGIRSAALAISCLALVGCTVTDSPKRDPVDTDGLMLLEQIGRSLPGSYSNHAQWRAEPQDADAPVVLEVLPDPVVDPGRLRFRLVQQQGDAPLRSFTLTLGRAPGESRLTGEFAPLDRAGEARRACAMDFIVRGEGLVGETDPLSCRFGAGESATGLLKEIAIDGRRIVIADRVVRLPSGEPVASDQILVFDRIRRFAGWAGVREEGGWRLSQNVQLHSGGGRAQPRDAGGMSLGLGLELAYHVWREDQPPILRLAVSSLENGQLIGYAWADPDAAQIGLAVDDVQVGLNALTD